MKLPETTKSKLPNMLVSVMFLFSVWLFLRGLLKFIYLWLLQIGYSPITIPFIIGDPLKNTFLIETFLSFILLINMWLLSTRVNFYQGIKMRIVTFLVMILGIVFQFLWSATRTVYVGLIPYIVNHQNMIYVDDYALEQALFSNTPNLMLFLLSLPTVFIFIVLMWVKKLCNEHWKDLLKFFKDFEYKLRIPSFITVFMSEDRKRKLSKDIKEFFDEKNPNVIPLPDVAIGPNTKTDEMVIQRGKDRTLNNLIIGAIGTGKTSAIVLPILNQDLHHMTYMINNFRNFYSREDYQTEDVKGRFFNGISVIEPSKDLCDKTYKLVKAHGIPDEAIFYIDPTNPDTPSINLFKGPTDKVAETFTMVVSGIGESQEYFFEQSQRSHLKHHIFLLKEHNPEADAGFEDLINMYNDAQLVAQMHQKLKARLSSMGDISTIEDRDKRNHLLILKGISDWFDLTYVPAQVGHGLNTKPDIIKEGPYRGQHRVEDRKSEHVVGLRNILNDIASNILLRRVLFGKSDFDFDKHLEFGGILLVNTAKGELSSLSDVLGKFVLLSLQNAVFRRKPNDSPYHHILVDEFPDYIAEDFASFPAQSRKYKAIITVVAQTVSQLQRKYGPDFMTTLVATLRNKFVYGDGTQLDAEMFSAIFGEKTVYEESETDQEVSPLMENPVRRTGKSYSKSERATMTVSDLIYQDAFVAAVKLVEDNTPIQAQQVQANFISKSEFEQSPVTVIQEEGNYWLDIRRSSLNGTVPTSEQNEQPSFQDTEAIIDDQDMNFVLPETQIRRPLKTEVNYNSNSALIIDQSMLEEEPLSKQKDKQQDELGTQNKEEELVPYLDTLENEEPSISQTESLADLLVGPAVESPSDSSMNLLLETNDEIKEEISYHGEGLGISSDSISFNDIFSDIISEPKNELEIDSVHDSKIVDGSPAIFQNDMSSKDEEQNDSKNIDNDNPFDTSFIKPIGHTAPIEEEKKDKKESNSTHKKVQVDEEELKSYEAGKKELQRRKIEESRRRLELERENKEKLQNKINQESKESSNEIKTLNEDTSENKIAEKPVSKSILQEQEHEEWKQQQIREKRTVRQKTKVGDYSLFNDILEVLNDKEK